MNYCSNCILFSASSSQIFPALRLLLKKLADFAEQDYVLVFFSAPAFYQPGWSWLFKAYRSIDRKSVLFSLSPFYRSDTAKTWRISTSCTHSRGLRSLFEQWVPYSVQNLPKRLLGSRHYQSWLSSFLSVRSTFQTWSCSTPFNSPQLED